MPKIYTKTGDAGETSLASGARVAKDCITMQVVGALDELNAALGLSAAVIASDACLPVGRKQSPHEIATSFAFGELLAMTEKIQRDLFKVGGEVVILQSDLNKSVDKIGESEIVELENWTDKFWQDLPELKHFILPGGSLESAQLHLARAICRRTERELVAFGRTAKLRPEVYQYLNRLSSFLFAAARYVNFKNSVKETVI